MNIRHILSGAMLCIAAAGVFAADDEIKVTLGWDTPGAVSVALGGINSDPVQLGADAKSYTVTETGYVYIRPAEGFILKSVTDNAGTQQKISASDSRGQYCSLSLWGSDNGRSFDIVTDKLETVGSIAVNIENGARKINAYLTNNDDNYTWSTFSRPQFKNGEQKVPLTAYDKEIVIYKANDLATIHSIKLNGEPLEFKNYMSIPLTPGDRLDIRAYENDEDDAEPCKVVVAFVDNMRQCLNSVFNITASKFIPAADIETGFEVDKGQKLRFNLNEDYEILGLTANGEPVTLNGGTTVEAVVEANTTYVFEARKKTYADVEAVIYVNNPDGLVIRKGAFADDEEIALGNGEPVTENVVFEYANGQKYTIPANKAYKYTISVPGKTRKFFVDARPGYWINEGILANPEDVEDIYARASVIADNAPVYFDVRKVEANSTAIVYYEGEESGVRFYAQNKNISGRLIPEGLDSEVLPVGYTVVGYDKDYHQSFTTGRNGSAPGMQVVAFLDNTKLKEDDNMAFSAITFAPNSVLKIFSLPEGTNPSMSTIRFEAGEGHTATVTYDMVKSHSNLAKNLEVIGKTLVEVRPAAAEGVLLDGNRLEASADGVYRFTATAKAHTVTLTDANAVEGIEAESVENAKIYNLQGVEMNGAFESLPAGVYIIGGKKVIKN